MVEAGSRTVCKWTHEGLNKAQASTSGRKPALMGRNVIAFLKRMVHETINEGGTAGITLVLYEDERFLFKREAENAEGRKTHEKNDGKDYDSSSMRIDGWMQHFCRKRRN